MKKSILVHLGSTKNLMIFSLGLFFFLELERVGNASPHTVKAEYKLLTPFVLELEFGNVPAEHQLRSKKKYTASLSSISWIPASAGLPVHDNEPQKSYPSALVTPSTNQIRFSNQFSATLIVEDWTDYKKIKMIAIDHSLFGNTFRIDPFLYYNLADPKQVINFDHGIGYEVTWTVGARTKLPNPDGVMHPIRKNEPVIFPIIWTQHVLRIYEDGFIEEKPCTAWSHFPQHYCYDTKGNFVKTNSPNPELWKKEGKGNFRQLSDDLHQNENRFAGNPWNKR